MKKIERLTDLEIKIMKVLWEHEEAITIQQIADSLKQEKISVQSVTQAMKRLVTKKAVMIPEHILVSNVYARTFCPCYTREEFMVAEFVRLQNNIFGRKKFGISGMTAALFSNTDEKEIQKEEIDELQKIIDSKKKSIEMKEGR